LKELACGHLGMTDCKDLKRNFQELVAELESCGYLKKRDLATRYENIRPGVWRVHLELDPSRLRSGSRSADTDPKSNRCLDPARDAARELVRLYHRHRFGRSDYQPLRHELGRAKALLEKCESAVLSQLVPSIARTVERQYRGADLYFGSAVPYFVVAIERREKQHVVRERHADREHGELAEDTVIMAQKRLRYERRQQLLRRWKLLSADDQRRHHEMAIAAACSDFDRRRLSAANLDDPPREALEQMDRACRGPASQSEIAAV
jgi:hypothetical protein